MRMTESDLLRRIAERRREEQEIPRAFVRAILDDNPDGLSFGSLDFTCSGWKKAFRRCAKLTAVPVRMKRLILEAWVNSGIHIRQEVGDDLILATALRVLLPPYTGGALTLYRGDSAYNRRRRMYGLSWTTSEDVADSFARGMWRTFDGGSVVLHAQVPQGAIICALAQNDEDSHGEEECLVDRRLLREVTVLRRYSQAAMANLVASAATE
jgi:hypothetical protein